jgi:hypothetical protein
MSTLRHTYSVIFTHIFQSGTKEELPVVHFVEVLSDWDETLHSYTEIRENVDLELSFHCDDEGAKCYMDGFDVLTNGQLAVDEADGENFLACNQTVTLYKYTTSDNYYPYIPGLYSLRVVTSDGKTFYTLAKVISNRLFEDQLDTMRREVEEQLKGEALDVIRKQHSPKSLKALQIDPKLFRQYQVLQHYFADISAVISDLAKRVRSSVAKEYQMQPADQPAHVDVVSIQHRLKRPDTMNMVMSVNKRINYDLPENRVLKTILEKWIRLLHEFVETMDVTIEGLSNHKGYAFAFSLPLERRRRLVEELKEYRDRASRMNGALNIVKSSHWYREVSVVREYSVPNVMFMDIRYRKLYQINQALQSDELPPATTSTGLGQQWKRTDQLYEIWGWLQVVGFAGRLVGSGDRSLCPPLVPEVQPVSKDNMVQFEYGNFRLHITYDGTIPNSPEAADMWTVPIYTTGTNNNPDVRMDLFVDKVFIGTIMIDMKYRKKHALTDSMRQLTSYADNVRSPYIYGKKRWQRFRPVHQVLVLYPEKRGMVDAEPLEGRSISLVPLTPAENQTVFQETLRNLVEEMLLEAEEEGIVVGERVSWE